VAEYIALVFCLIGIMMYLLDLAFSLSDNYDSLKMFLIGVSMFFGAIVLNISSEIAISNGAGAAITTSMDVAYWAWLVLTGLVMTYLVIYMIIRGWNSISGKNKLKLYDEENR
jgi:hypothetical protein